MVLAYLLLAALLISPSMAFCGIAHTGPAAQPEPTTVAGSPDRGWGVVEELLSIPSRAEPSQQQSKSSKKASSSSKKKTTKKKRKKPAIQFAGSAVFQTIYDDNILRYSDGFIDEFRRNDPPEKYVVETYDDVIFSPRLFVNFTAQPINKVKTRLYLGFITWQYGRNPEKNNDLWLLRLRQYTGWADYLEFSYSYSPTSYIRHLSDRHPFNEPRSSTDLQWRPFNSVRHGMGLSFMHRFVKQFRVSAELGRVLRFYNQPFMENDNWEWNGFTDFTWYPSSRWRFYGKYMYADADARAYRVEGETAATSDEGDGSYERDLYEASIRYRPKGGFWAIKEFVVKGQRMEYYFTGTKPAWKDPLHTGRKDEVGVVEFTMGTKTLFGSMSFEYGYRFAQRVSSLPGTFEGEDAEDKDYTNNRTWLEVRYSL
jgi:hypothetical protein